MNIRYLNYKNCQFRVSRVAFRNRQNKLCFQYDLSIRAVIGDPLGIPYITLCMSIALKDLRYYLNAYAEQANRHYYLSSWKD